jgi:predicted negative regulator of RcsB-dependent stress response
MIQYRGMQEEMERQLKGEASEKVGEREGGREVKTKKKKRGKLIITFLILLVAIAGYGYYWYQDTNALRQEAIGLIDRAQKFEVLNKAVEKEQSRCENFISQQEGDFGSFEYCKKFIEWADLNSPVE